MKYVRSPVLHQFLTPDGQPTDLATLMAARRGVVDQFNAAMGGPAEVVRAMQDEFVDGTMTRDEMVSYVRYCEFMIGAVQDRLADSAT